MKKYSKKQVMNALKHCSNILEMDGDDELFKVLEDIFNTDMGEFIEIFNKLYEDSTKVPPPLPVDNVASNYGLDNVIKTISEYKPIKKIRGCKFREYDNWCKEDGYPYCTKHTEAKCFKCGEQAVRYCGYAGSFGICGVDECDNHSHMDAHRKKGLDY